jgi:hypothetical protein
VKAKIAHGGSHRGLEVNSVYKEQEVKAKIDQYLTEKKFDKAAELAVIAVFVSIPPEEIVEVLMKAIRDYKASTLSGKESRSER